MNFHTKTHDCHTHNVWYKEHTSEYAELLQSSSSGLLQFASANTLARIMNRIVYLAVNPRLVRSPKNSRTKSYSFLNPMNTGLGQMPFHFVKGIITAHNKWNVKHYQTRTMAGIVYNTLSNRSFFFLPIESLPCFVLSLVCICLLYLLYLDIKGNISHNLL